MSNLRRISNSAKVKFCENTSFIIRKGIKTVNMFYLFYIFFPFSTATHNTYRLLLLISLVIK